MLNVKLRKCVQLCVMVWFNYILLQSLFSTLKMSYFSLFSQHSETYNIPSVLHWIVINYIREVWWKMQSIIHRKPWRPDGPWSQMNCPQHLHTSCVLEISQFSNSKVTVHANIELVCSPKPLGSVFCALSFSVCQSPYPLWSHFKII